MESNETALEDARIPSKLIPDEVFTNLILLWPSLLLLICPLGLWANGMAIRTFLRMGLNDSITISFFYLGLSDFAHVFCPLISLVVYVLNFMEARFQFFFRVHSLVVFFYVSAFAMTFNKLTIFITVFLAVQRCLCIVKPLHFRDMFTKKLTWGIMGSFSLLSSVTPVTFLASFGTIEMANPYTNVSQVIITTKPWWIYVDTYLGTMAFVVFPIVSQCLVFGSVIVMSYGLKASIKFRKEASQKNSAFDKSLDQENDAGGKQTSKERTAIIQVVILSSIFLATNLPKIIHNISLVLNPDLGQGGKYENTYRVFVGIRTSCDYLNSAVNFFIYYKYNSRFRKLCFAPRKEVTQGD